MSEFNTRVQTVVDAHERSQGYKPTPGLVLVAAKSQVPTPDLPKLFDIPRTKAAGKAWSFFKKTNGVIETTNPLDSASSVVPGSDLTPDALKFAADEFQGMTREAKRAFFMSLQGLSPHTRMRLLRRAGFLSSGNVPVGREDVRQAGQKGLEGAATGAEYGFTAVSSFAGGLALGIPALAYEEGKAVKESVEQRSLRPLGKAQVELGKATLGSVVEVAKDPLAAENVGFTAQFILGGAGLAGGVTSRVAAGSLRKVPAGRTTVKYGDTEVQLLNSENSAYRPIQLGIRRFREKRAQKRFREADDFQAVPTDALPVFEGRNTFAGRHFSWEKKLGREADKRARLERQLRLMTRNDLQQVAGWSHKWTAVRERLPEKSLHGLSRAEQVALIARSLDDPNPIATMRQFHEEKLLEGPKPWRERYGDVDPAVWERNHQQALRDVAAAEKALANPSERFQKAVVLVDRAVAEMESIKINEAHFSQLTADQRVVKAAEVYRTGQPFENLSKIGKEIERIEKKQTAETATPDDVKRLATLKKKGSATQGRLADLPAREGGHYMPFVSASKRKRTPKDLFRGSRLNFFGAIGRKQLRQQFPELYHEFTGKSIIAGDYRIDATGLIGEALGSAVQGAYRMSQYRDLLAKASKSPKSQYDRAILKPDADGWPDPIKAFLMKPDEGQVTRTDAMAMSRQDWNEMTRVIFPGVFENGKWTVPADKIGDVLWVDERLLSPAAFTQPVPSKLPKGMQFVQDVFRVPALYLKLSYAWNLLPNNVMALIYTGPMAVKNIAKAYFHKSWLDDSTWEFFAESVGVGKFGSYVDDAFSSRFSRRAAHFWNNLTDTHARVGVAFHYAAELGYKTGDDLKRLVDDARKDPKSKAFEDLLEIKERTNKAMVQLDNLTWFESAVLRHAIFVYPWRRGQAIWSLRTLVEKPAKASVLAALGKEEGEEVVDAFMGMVPEWFKRNGYLPTRFDSNGDPLVTAPATLHTWGDFQSIFDPQLARSAGPLIQIGVERFKQDQFGNEHARDHEVVKWFNAFKEVYAGLPQVRAARGRDEGGELPPVDITDRNTLIRRMNAADDEVVFAPGFWGGWGYLVTGPAFTERAVNELALQADWYKELPQEERHRFNVASRETVLGLQAQALKRPVPQAVERALGVFNDRDKFRMEWQRNNHRDFTPLEQSLAEIDFYAKKNLIPDGQLDDLKKEAKRQEDADAHEQFRQDLFDAFGDPRGALKEWDSDVRMVAALSKSKIVNKRLAELAKDGLLGREARTVGLPVKTLREYGRAVLGWYEKNREWRDRLDTVSDPDEQNIMWQEYREWLNVNDKPVTVGGKTLPSPARIEWARYDEDTRREIVADRATRPWAQLSTLDKELLGRKVDAKAAEGWRRLEEIIVEQRQQMPPGDRRFPPGHELNLAKYVDRNFAPGFYKDWLFSREPLVIRLQRFTPIQKSRFAGVWRDVLAAAASYASYLRSDDYDKTLVRDLWRDYVRGSLQPWADSQPGFRDEMQMYGPDVLFRLLD